MDAKIYEVPCEGGEKPTPSPTATPTPRPTVQGVLASTGNSAFIYAIIVTGSTSLIAGLILKKFSK
jgi:hypothetical protein